MKFAPLVSYQMSALGPFSLFAADGLVKSVRDIEVSACAVSFFGVIILA